MPILTAAELSQSFGAQDLFSGLDVKLEAKDRVGLVGPNGCGKTTLLMILAGLREPTGGVVQRQSDLTLGYLRQEAVLTFAGQDNTVYEEMLTVFGDLRALEAQLRELEAAMTAGDVSEAVLERYGRVQTRYEVDGGYDYHVNIKRVLQGLGFPPDQWDMPLSYLSGGQKTRVLLGRLLLEAPDLLILDEPTNHLDMAAVEWLERTLRTWNGALILVSHDRYFLDSVANQVWELRPAALRTYRGGYSSYVQQRQEQWEREVKLFEAERERMEKELDFIRRNIAGGSADVAKGKLKRLTRDIVLMEEYGPAAKEGKNWMQIGERVRTFSANEAAKRLRSLRPPADGPPRLNIRLQAAERSARSVLRSRRLTIGYPGAPLFTTDPIQLDRGSCAALIGPNGSGKSTLLRTVLGELEPLEGSLKFGDGVQVGYFAQAHEQLNPRSRVLDELLAYRPMSQEDARGYLAQYLFRGDDVFKRVSELSGGERGRLALALLAAVGANFLLLDEPTNHLDIPSQEILQSVLEQFDGTILLVSHDRYLVSRLSDQIWEIGPQGEGGLAHMMVFEGTYANYVHWREGRAEEAETAVANTPLGWVDDLTPPPVGRQAQRDAVHRRYALQGSIEDAEFQLERLAFALREARAQDDAARVAELEAAHVAARTELERLNAELEALGDWSPLD